MRYCRGDRALCSEPFSISWDLGYHLKLLGVFFNKTFYLNKLNLATSF